MPPHCQLFVDFSQFLPHITFTHPGPTSPSRTSCIIVFASKQEKHMPQHTEPPKVHQYDDVSSLAHAATACLYQELYTNLTSTCPHPDLQTTKRNCTNHHTNGPTAPQPATYHREGRQQLRGPLVPSQVFAGFLEAKNGFKKSSVFARLTCVP